MEGGEKKYGYMTSDGSTYHLLLEKARYNRSHPTEAESMLWNYASSEDNILFMIIFLILSAFH